MSKPIWIFPFTSADVNERAKNTLSDYLRIEFIEVGSHHLTARMPITASVLQPMGVVHGGATAALAETVASAAANYCVNLTQVCVGLELNINHFRPVSTGYVEAVTMPLHLGKTTQVWEIKIYNEHKKLVSAARLTLAIIDRPSQKKTG